MVGSAQTVKYQHTDALGTPIAVTGANKALIQTSEYEPYGQLLNRTLTDSPGFTGHVQDALTGLTYMQQRYYDQGIGRFLSTDPVTAYSSPGANFNRYWYANKNPYKFKGPDGRVVEIFWDIANVAMDVASLRSNLAVGNYGGAALDAGGLIVDTAATLIPGVPGGAGTAIKVDRGADAVLAANKAAGKAGEAATLASRGSEIGGKQVTFKTSDGTRTRIDFTKSDKSGVIKTKPGKGGLTKGQAKLEADILAGSAVTPVGKNAEAAV